MKKTITFSIFMSMICSTFWGQQGLQIALENHAYSIDFETTMDNVNYGEFTAKGFSPNPTIAGKLNSNAWEVHGMSDGDLDFGGSASNGDFARGVSSVPVGVGGIYSFLLMPSNNILGIQATTQDCTPGSIGFRMQNKTDAPINSLQVSYDAYVYNDQPGSGYFSLSHRADNSAFTEILESNIITTDPAATTPTWIKTLMNFKISGLSIATDEFYYVRWNIKNTLSGELDQFGIDNITFIANPDPGPYVYNDNDNDWTPSDPNLSPENVTSDSNFQIQHGTAVLSNNFSLGNISVAEGATVIIKKGLRIEEGIVNNGSIIFESDSSSTGQLGNMTGAAYSGTGNVTVQRFIPARDDGNGAYRYLTSAVNSTGSIHANWQEGANSMENPNPGFGMFITGATDSLAGFDTTPVSPPSMFTFNNNSQEYVAIPNTNTDQLTAGNPYAAYVWGDRSVDIILTTNDPDATSTTLRATGALVIDDHSFSLAAGPSGFNLIGNPYQASVNMHDVMTLSTNVNQNHYYVWNPNLADRGAYTTVDLNNGSSTMGGEANQYLMPGQAAWVVSTAAGAILNFEEQAKNAWAESTDVFRPETSDIAGFIGLQLYQAERFDNEETMSDGIRVNFSENGDNSVQANDASKLYNMDENIGFANEGNILSIEYRAFPIDGEILAISINQYRTANYVFNAIVNDLPTDTKAYLKDNYLQIKTELTNNETTPISFSVEASNMASIAADRFSIVFERSPLGVNETVAQKLSIYPNPVRNGEFFIEVPGISGEKVQVSLFNVLGQEVYRSSNIVSANGRINVPASSLKAGVYVVKTEHNGKTFTGKVVIQ